jgi:hypothetical protein
MVVDMATYFEEFQPATMLATLYREDRYVMYSGPVEEIKLESSPSFPYRIAIEWSGQEGALNLVDDDDNEETIPLEDGMRKVSELVMSKNTLPDIDISPEDLKGSIVLEAVHIDGQPEKRAISKSIEIILFPISDIASHAAGSGYQNIKYTIFTKEEISIGDRITFTDHFQGGVSVTVYAKSVTGGVDLEDGHIEYRMVLCG